MVVTPTGQFKDKSDFNYQQVRVNVNCLKLIQAGFTFVNEAGELPPGNDVWQFNFHFDPLQDVIAHDSGELLRNAGIDFDLHQVLTFPISSQFLLTARNLVTNSG